MGIGVFYSALHSLTQDEQHLNKCLSYIDRVIKKSPGANLDFTMSRGYTGIAWGLEYLSRKKFIDIEADVLFSEIDSMVYLQALRSLLNGNTDFLTGGLGTVRYALNRLPNDRSAGFLQQFMAIANARNIPDRYVDLIRNFQHLQTMQPKDTIHQVNHIMNWVSVFISMWAKNFNRKEIEPIIARNLSALLTNYRESEYEEIPLSWHKGILNTAFTTWRAGVTFGDKSWQMEANQILDKTLRVDPYSAGADSSLYSGAAGIAYIYNKIYRQTGNVQYRERHDCWISALTVPKRKSGISHGFLEGMAGTGLVLIDHLQPTSEVWDECILGDLD
jgi:lantibiotic modifying enzyme